MAINSEDYRPTLNQWFESEFKYEGIGIAEFENPKGYIKGRTTIDVDELGNISIELNIENFETDSKLDIDDVHNLHWLLSGMKPITDYIGIMYAGGISNRCLHLRIETPQGHFDSVGNVHYTFDLWESRIVKFYVVNALFASNSTETSYWVMPLINFVSEDMRIVNRFPLEHPLRILAPARIEENLSEEEYQKALFDSTSSNCIIMFKRGENFGFIERLIDYKERTQELIDGKSKKRLTSLMICKCDRQINTYDELRDWAPLDLLHFLSLASGSHVGIPWIEFRDSKGALISRFHSQQWQENYSKGHATLDWTSRGSISYLLSNSPPSLEPNVRIGIHLTVKGGQVDQDSVDRLAYLCRAVETLTKEIRHKTQVDSQLKLDDKIREEIKTILQEAGKKINKIAQAASEKDRKEINRIAQTVFGATNKSPKRPDEGKALVILMKDLGLNDDSVIDNFDRLFNKYRNQIIHESYLKRFEHPSNEFFSILFHLHDILLRVLLKILKYEGYYKRAIPTKEGKSLDWVQPDTNPRELSYGRWNFDD